ncbi:MAG: hypothetical protein KBA71_12055 [Opitutaceae bacterium]|nr:hypothetical protein [Opitutaceae bacterium]
MAAFDLDTASPSLSARKTPTVHPTISIQIVRYPVQKPLSRPSSSKLSDAPPCQRPILFSSFSHGFVHGGNSPVSIRAKGFEEFDVPFTRIFTAI